MYYRLVFFLINSLNENPVCGLVVAQKDWAVEEERMRRGIDLIRDGEPFREPTDHIVGPHARRIETSSEAGLLER